MMPEDQEDPELARQITNHVAAILYPALATETPAAEIRCPVFLAHGSYDDLIPPEESVFLRAKILQARSYLLVSPFLTHTHPWGKPLGWAAKARASLGLFAFLYHLAGAVN
jgi:pimeloyl-ACP methyl ester carboxylesterase